MCTVCGHFAIDNKIVSNDIYDMLKKMEHRGPDTHGVYLDGAVFRVQEVDELKSTLIKRTRVALGHSRLQIVGQEVTTQPFVSCDGRLTLIHNGEIYNYQKLKTLLSSDHQIKTTSDSEIVVHLLEETYQGNLVDAVRNLMGLLDGMYVLAVTDGETLTVARDPVGKKPLYYVENDGVVYFASEKKALWNGRTVPTRLHPGDILSIDSRGHQIHQGTRLSAPQIDIVDFRQAVEAYKDALTKGVRKRLVGLTEEHLGVIFSGGIDSVLIAKLLQQEGKNISCYCTGTKESGDIQAASEAASELGLTLHTKILDESLVERVLPEIIREVEESGLLQVEVAIPMYFAAEMASEEEIRVMFTGQAADELFAGYSWYGDFLEQAGYLRLHEKLWEDLKALYTDTLEREDKVTMAHSIELRAPYLDRDVIETAMRISPRLKIQGADDLVRKWVHRQVAVELGIPPSLAFRTKDPAQSGSGIHEMIENVARQSVTRMNETRAEENERSDKGSLYRYQKKSYGSDLTRSYLGQLQKDLEKKYIAPFLVPADTQP